MGLNSVNLKRREPSGTPAKKVVVLERGGGYNVLRHVAQCRLPFGMLNNNPKFCSIIKWLTVLKKRSNWSTLRNKTKFMLCSIKLKCNKPRNPVTSFYYNVRNIRYTLHFVERITCGLMWVKDHGHTTAVVPHLFCDAFFETRLGRNVTVSARANNEES